MKSLHIDEFWSSGFNSEFDRISTLELADTPFGSGGFGEVFACEAVNGSVSSVRLAVKVFEENGQGSVAQCFDTIRNLQIRIIQRNIELEAQGSPRLEAHAGLRALPQFSFRGTLQNQQVWGYASLRLDTLGYVPFEEVFEDPDLFLEYEKLSVPERLELAFDLVRAFKTLRELSFIHADVNPHNLFVNIAERHLEVIDFDSGAVTDNPGDSPSTWGKRNEWLAPEIVRQCGAASGANRTVKVDQFTDTWSVGVGVHELLFLFHPLFYLRNLGEKTVLSYLSRYRWPEIDKSDPSYNSDVDAVYDAYRQDLADLPPGILERIQTLVSRGYENPVLRPSYGQWVVALREVQKPPEIQLFRVSPTAVIAGMPVRIEWEVVGAQQVRLDPVVGTVADRGSIELLPGEDQTYYLSATGRYGEVTAGPVVVRVWGTPVVQSLLVPTPVIQSQLQFPYIHLDSTHLQLHLNPPKWTPLDTRWLQNTPLDRPLSSPPPVASSSIGRSASNWNFGIKKLFAQLWVELETRLGVRP